MVDLILYQDGRYVPEEQVFVSPFDHGFLYGIGLFETIRIYDGHPFLLDEHLQRLNDGLKELFIDYCLEHDVTLDILQQLLIKNDLRHARVRINISAGEGLVGLPSDMYKNPSVIFFISPLLKPNDELQEKKAKILQIPRNLPETNYRLKSFHYGNNIAAKMELRSHPEMEGIFLTKEGFISEAITSNIFWVKQNILYTPNQSTGILVGITRQFILSLAKKLDIIVREGCFRLEEMKDADEVFITNSIQEIVAITEIDQIGKYAGRCGELTNRLFTAYKKNRSTIQQGG